MGRPSREDTLMFIAQTMALRSTCLRRRVGCLITLEGRIISSGYNGQPQPYEKTCEDLCVVGKPCEIATHAEINALNMLRKTLGYNGILFIPNLILYTTTSPCLKCSEEIYFSGIKEVRYLEEYRDNSGILFLSEKGVNVKKHTYTWRFPSINS